MHRVFGVQILAIEHFETSITHSNTNFCLGIDTDLSDILLELVCMLYDLAGVVKKEYFCRGHKQDIIFHVLFGVKGRHAIPIEEEKVPNVNILTFI